MEELVACGDASDRALPIMRALILSDIHSNIDALEAVLAAAPAYDVVWNLGDLVGYGAAPKLVLQRVREIGSVFVRGNHDRACCGLTDAESFNPVALAAVRWTERQLDAETTRWLRAIPSGPVYPGEVSAPGEASAHNSATEADRVKVSCVHGSPLDEDHYLVAARDAGPQLVRARARTTFFGHTHIQGGFTATGDGECVDLKPVYSAENDAESYALDLRESATYLINPGSVGQPRDRDWRAAFALYDDAADRVTFWRVPYDVHLAQMRIVRAGLPEALGSRLRVGR